MELLIKNVRIIDSSQNFIGDVYIKDGKIEQVGQDINKECHVIHGEGFQLLPSFIDLHSHFRDPGLTYKEDILTGSMASVKGGYTAVNLMANTKPVCSTMDIVNYVVDKSRYIGLIDISQTLSITKDSLGQDISHLDFADNTVRFLSDDGKGVNRSDIMYKAMVKAKEKNYTIISHAEDSLLTDISSRLSENLMTFRDIELSKLTGCHLHLAHVSTKEAISYIIEAKKAGANVTCEVTPHHIGLNDEIKYKVNPHLRSREDVEVLIQAIEDGWVDAIGTDHAPHSSEDKQNGAAGISGIETAFSVCYTKLVRAGHINLSKLSEIMSKRPAEIMHLNKGKIETGYDGDLVLVDTEKKYKVAKNDFASKGKNTPFDGIELYGKVIMTIKAGMVVFNRGKFILKQGQLVIDNWVIEDEY